MPVPARRAAGVLAATGAVLLGCGQQPTVFGDDAECGGGSASGEHAVSVRAEVRDPAGRAPSAWAGLQQRDGTPATSVPRCFDGALLLVLADRGDSRVLDAEVGRDAVRTVEAADGGGELLLRDSASALEDLSAAQDGGGGLAPFPGWYVHLGEPAAGTYAWEWPVTWRAPPDAGGGGGTGSVSLRMVVEEAR